VSQETFFFFGNQNVKPRLAFSKNGREEEDGSLKLISSPFTIVPSFFGLEILILPTSPKTAFIPSPRSREMSGVIKGSIPGAFALPLKNTNCLIIKNHYLGHQNLIPRLALKGIGNLKPSFLSF
jgi:hypothetical protein